MMLNIHVKLPWKENLQKYIHCRVSEDQSRKVRLFQVAYAIEVTLFHKYESNELIKS